MDKIEEFIATYGEQLDGTTGLQNMIAHVKSEYENALFESVMEEIHRRCVKT